LLDNAAKFTQNGLVKLEIFRQGHKAGERIVFRVHDTGIGFEPERAVDIFNPFVKLDVPTVHKYTSTGMGLFFSQHLCQRMGGDIGVESTPGKGAVFSFWLPAKPKLS
jgi:signal transduction histidine kinase